MEHIPEQQIDSIIKLFVTWNNHQNEDIGDRMADRFEKWFDCLTTSHLGENKSKKQAYTKVCQQFGSQLGQVTKPKELVPFAYQLLQQELEKQHSVIKHFDVTGGTSAGDMVQNVWPNLSQTSQNLLLQVYANLKTPSQSEMLPLLQARYELKKALFLEYFKSQDFDWVLGSDHIDRDLIPLPLYEAKILKNKIEQQYFECWLINAPIICRDVQEFSPFGHALSQGCIEVQIKIANEPVPIIEENTPNSFSDQNRVNDRLPEPVDNVNSIIKPFILLLLTAAILGGICIILFGET
jgi:hypothetical protein